MDLLTEIRNDIMGDTTKLSSILRKARVLASLLNNDAFENWVTFELNGYVNDDDLPEYRKLFVQSTGDFAGPFGRMVSNLTIPTVNLPNSVKEFMDETFIKEGVRSLESLVENTSKQVIVQWPPNMIAFCQDKIYENLNMYSAQKRFGINSIEQILDSIRNKLLDFVLQLMKENPSVNSEEELKLIPKENITSAFQAHISGSYNSSK